jgi:hypothetical protein
MSGATDYPVLLWPVACFDRRRENPLPVYTKWYWLDWSQLTAEQATEILTILRKTRRAESPHKPVGFEESVVTISIGGTRHDTALLKYRPLFTEVPSNEIEAFLNHPSQRDRGVQTVDIAAEYFEDETGAAISHHEMIQNVSGQEFPIIVGDPESVMRLGAISAVNRSDWSVERANTIAQFLDVVERIHSSQWYRSPQFMTSLVRCAEEPRLLAASFPDDRNTMSVLAYFRQLHAGDQLVVKARDVYVKHAGDGRKQWWVDERKRRFESIVDSEPAPFHADGRSRRQIVRMFMYGAGLLHSSSSHGDDAALAEFVSRHGTQRAVMTFNSCLMDFYRVAAQIYHVVRQDFLYWIDEDGLVAPSRVSIPKLFEGFSSPPHGT